MKETHPAVTFYMIRPVRNGYLPHTKGGGDGDAEVGAISEIQKPPEKMPEVNQKEFQKR